MVAVCEKCGSIGYAENLVYCSSCHVSAEHRYCLDEYPNVSKQSEVDWSCSDCARLKLGRRSERIVIKKEQGKLNKQNKTPMCEPISAAATGVDSKSTAAASCLSTEKKTGPVDGKILKKNPKAEAGSQQQCVKLEHKEKKEHSTSSHVEAPVEENKDFGRQNPRKPNTQFIGANEESGLDKNGGYLSDESEFRAVRRKSHPRKAFISESQGFFSEENPEPVGVTSEASVAMEEVGDSFPVKETDEGKGEVIVRGLQQCSDFEPYGSKSSKEVPYDYHYKSDDDPHHLNLSESSNDLRVYPLTDPVWRGWFNIFKRKKDTHFRLGAYLSNHACSKACDASRGLKPMLDLEILPKSEIWPTFFKMSSPTVEAIALFFFPEYERDEAVFDDVLDGMIGKGLALRSVFAEFELLVFSSLEFPYEDWRICRKYYMWGVFQEKDSR